MDQLPQSRGHPVVPAGAGRPLPGPGQVIERIGLWRQASPDLPTTNEHANRLAGNLAELPFRCPWIYAEFIVQTCH